MEATLTQTERDERKAWRLRVMLAEREDEMIAARTRLAAITYPAQQEIDRFLRLRKTVQRLRSDLRRLTGGPIVCERCRQELLGRGDARATMTGFEHKTPCNGFPVELFPKEAASL